MSQLKILTNNVADIATITVANTAAEEFTPDLLEVINTQLVRLGLTLNRIVEND